MSQDKEREAFEAWYFDTFTKPAGKQDDGQYKFRTERYMWLAWQARAAFASQQAVKGEPIGWRHKQYGHVQWRTPDMPPEVADRYTQNGQWVSFYASPPSREPLTDGAILDAFCHTPGIHQFVQAFKAGARFAERAHLGIHSRGEGEKA